MSDTLPSRLGGQVLVVYGEHRYFGESYPYGKSNQTSSAYRHLSVENTLCDFLQLLKHVKKEYGIEQAQVVSIGGSYSGEIAAWLRMKYPHEV